MRIPGAEASGDFNVIVTREGFGNAVPSPANSNLFTYGIFVTSITPTTGSINGGTVLTITG